MKTLFDTSILVAALVENHSKHERALPWLSKAKAKEFEFVVSSHTLQESFDYNTFITPMRLPVHKLV